MAALIFIGLNIVDASLTKAALGYGAQELNPLVTPFGENMLVKGLAAAVVVLALYFLGKEGLLRYLNFAMFGIVLWNLAMCVILSIGGAL